MAPPLSHREGFKESFKTPQTRGFKAKVSRASYKFGTFMHWVFFKPTADVAVDDLAQTSFAPVSPQDAGASATDMQNDSSMRGRTMGANRHMVEHDGPSGLQVAKHRDQHGNPAISREW